MLKFVPIFADVFQGNAAVAMLAAQAFSDLRRFYEKRPDFGDYEAAIKAISAGEVILGALIEMETGGYKAALSFHMEGKTAFVDAYIGKLSDYTASGEAFENYARELGAEAIETDTKPSYAVQTGKLGYELKSFHWRKELLQ